ncbi:glutathione S-transferase family protein [Roseobacter sp. YSTF-M11]|uniref:Glutathione S-transferase family protein n=1 Tax=Roseobacter insulae TaxID=2859783 RepID=A0A9X1FRD2_9RHOB|nr:glutathione S-transferase family protein [Roseobacter insulae]MBW4706325.1 glutathione S-transferase family protein [Roseobacter insulae]
MTLQFDTHDLAKKARLAAVGDPGRRTVVSADHPRPDTPRDENAADPRLELFHFVMSICSQKSRAALFEAGLEYGSNEVVIMPPVNENYIEQYVALRMASQAAAEQPLVGGYTGATGVHGEGFDPMVVPTLVDHETGQVITDSRDIALYANTLSGDRLVPETIHDAVMKQVDIVDGLPHAGLFYGANPDGDHRPPPIQAGMNGAHLKKIEQVERRKAELPVDSPLHAAYAHKLKKERAGKAFIADPDNMRALIEQTKTAINALEVDLTATRTSWVTGDTFTLADTFWGVSLFRLLYLGYDWIWAELPGVSAYADRCFARPSILAGAISWPGHPPGAAIERYAV